MPQLEIAALSLEDGIAAQDGGADSIEISRDLSVGGLTPDFDLVRRTRDALRIDIHVMVRPHARDFCYTEREFDTILEDARALAQTGITGVVFGKGVLGVVPRVLTAGPAPTAWEGRHALAQWIRLYGDRLTFVVSGGLKLEQLPEMLATVNAHAYHFGGAARASNRVDADKVRALRAIVKGDHA
jgi:copper homeostasis protein